MREATANLWLNLQIWCGRLVKKSRETANAATMLDIVEETSAGCR